mmetsp:Transcript_78/g.147  ORF Transcript_78/g.147 Transcript_78/m.147 type:complete len:269 (-) Transcript_78:241-1047(-)
MPLAMLRGGAMASILQPIPLHVRHLAESAAHVDDRAREDVRGHHAAHGGIHAGELGAPCAARLVGERLQRAHLVQEVSPVVRGARLKRTHKGRRGLSGQRGQGRGAVERGALRRGRGDEQVLKALLIRRGARGASTAPRVSAMRVGGKGGAVGDHPGAQVQPLALEGEDQVASGVVRPHARAVAGAQLREGLRVVRLPSGDLLLLAPERRVQVLLTQSPLELSAAQVALALRLGLCTQVFARLGYGREGRAFHEETAQRSARAQGREP